jgi:hypothetical protein
MLSISRSVTFTPARFAQCSKNLGESLLRVPADLKAH